MQIGLLSDVHGNAPALSAILAELAQQQVQYILFAGDAIGYYPHVNEVIDQLRLMGCISVRGNHESCFFHELPVSDESWQVYRLDYVEQVISRENREWLAQLPQERLLKIGGVRILLCHGSPWAIDEYVYPDSHGFDRFAQLDVDVVAMGHTHIPMVQYAGNVLLINPGACGQPRDYIPGACYGILETDTLQVSLKRTTYDLAHMTETLKKMGYPQTLINILLRTKKKGEE